MIPCYFNLEIHIHLAQFCIQVCINSQKQNKKVTVFIIEEHKHLEQKIRLNCFEPDAVFQITEAIPHQLHELRH